MAADNGYRYGILPAVMFSRLFWAYLWGLWLFFSFFIGAWEQIELLVNNGMGHDHNHDHGAEATPAPEGVLFIVLGVVPSTIATTLFGFLLAVTLFLQKGYAEYRAELRAAKAQMPLGQYRLRFIGVLTCGLFNFGFMGSLKTKQPKSEYYRLLAYGPMMAIGILFITLAFFEVGSHFLSHVWGVISGFALIGVMLWSEFNVAKYGKRLLSATGVPHGTDN